MGGRTRAKEQDKTGAAPNAALELDRSFRGPLVAYFLKRVNSRSEAEDLGRLVMARKQRRGSLLVSTLVGGVFFRLGDTANAADPTYRFDIPREPLSQALTDFSQAAA